MARMTCFKNVRGAMDKLGDEIRNVHFWSWHAEVLEVGDCRTDLSDVDSLRVDTEEAAAWLRKYADDSELMKSLRAVGLDLKVGHEYESDDGDWTLWIDRGVA